jgi:inorganic pyrophosphatase
MVMLAILCLQGLLIAQVPEEAPNVLPERAAASLAASLEAAGRHDHHVWRDTPALTDDGLVNAYIEIPRGGRLKWEFDMTANARGLDRVLPEAVGGYPVNYGFVPQTISYDGDPFDVLVLGPPLPGGQVVRGAIVGLMLMEDEKGLDSKVVVSPVDQDGHPTDDLDASERDRIARYFRRYKRLQPDVFSRVPGWGSPASGRAHVVITHAFFRECRGRSSRPCRVER